MNPTIKDIAARADISYATVSRALNGKYGVSQETRDKVIALAEEMGYRPNAIAQGLVNRATMTVGLIIPDITSPFFPRVALGIEDRLLKSGYSVFLCNTNWNPDRERDYLNKLIQKQVDGIIISSIARHADDIETLIPKDMPLVYVSSYPEGTERSYVLIDNIKGADMAVSHLLSRKRRKIAFIGSEQEFISLDDRLSGYKKALKRAGIAISEDMVVLDKFQEQSGYKIIRELLENRNIPDGVFAENDLIAMGVVQGVQDSGYRVPEDVAVIGFDDIPIASHPDIQLSTIHQPKFRIGTYAAEMLLHQLSQDPAGRAVERMTLQPELIIRRST
jgi:LacI family transcriptional regulator